MVILFLVARVRVFLAGCTCLSPFLFRFFCSPVWAGGSSGMRAARKSTPQLNITRVFHTNLCEYYNPETSKQHKLHTAAAAAEPAKAAEPVS